MLFVYHLDRAAVLERMPVADKNLTGSANRDAIRESTKDSKPLAAVSVLPPEPANQVSSFITG